MSLSNDTWSFPSVLISTVVISIFSECITREDAPLESNSLLWWWINSLAWHRLIVSALNCLVSQGAEVFLEPVLALCHCNDTIKQFLFILSNKTVWHLKSELLYLLKGEECMIPFHWPPPAKAIIRYKRRKLRGDTLSLSKCSQGSHVDGGRVFTVWR